jgi:hypothetical protein
MSNDRPLTLPTPVIRYPRFNQLHEAIQMCQELSQIAANRIVWPWKAGLGPENRPR